MGMMDFSELVSEYRKRKFESIAWFLEFLSKLDHDAQRQIHKQFKDILRGSFGLDLLDSADLLRHFEDMLILLDEEGVFTREYLRRAEILCVTYRAEQEKIKSSAN